MFGAGRNSITDRLRVTIVARCIVLTMPMPMATLNSLIIVVSYGNYYCVSPGSRFEFPNCP